MRCLFLLCLLLALTSCKGKGGESSSGSDQTVSGTETLEDGTETVEDNDPPVDSGTTTGVTTGTSSGGTSTGGTGTGGTTSTTGGSAGGTTGGETPTEPPVLEKPTAIEAIKLEREGNSLKVSWKKSSNPNVKYSYKVSTKITDDQYPYTETTENSFKVSLLLLSPSKLKSYIKVKSHLNSFTSSTYIDTFYTFSNLNPKLEWAWTDVPLTPFVDKNVDAHSAVWTGTEMIVWGGKNEITPQNSGAAFNPSTNTWRQISTANAPSARYAHKAVWTGKRMLIVGGIVGSESEPVGGMYDPATDQWTPISDTNAKHRSGHSLTWADSYAIACGGKSFANVELTDCQSYDPETNSWSEFPTTNLSSYGHIAAWTGSQFLHWGGKTNGVASNLGNMPNTGNPLEARYLSQAAWTGKELYIFGGEQVDYTPNGAAYNPQTAKWTKVLYKEFDVPNSSGITHWTGTEIFFWGGQNGNPYGAAYNIYTKTWRTISAQSSPQSIIRRYFSSVWTGKEMIIWGGDQAPARKYYITNTDAFCGKTNQFCYGDSAEAVYARLTGLAYTPAGREIIYAMNPHGVKLWKDPATDRVLSANGSDSWLVDNEGLELKDFQKIKGRTCSGANCSYSY